MCLCVCVCINISIYYGCIYAYIFLKTCLPTRRKVSFDYVTRVVYRMTLSKFDALLP